LTKIALWPNASLPINQNDKTSIPRFDLSHAWADTRRARCHRAPLFAKFLVLLPRVDRDFAFHLPLRHPAHFEAGLPMTDQPNQSLRAALFGTVQGRIISALTIITLLLGIAVEGFVLYQSWQQVKINEAEIPKRQTESCIERAGAFALMPQVGAIKEEVEKLRKECPSVYVHSSGNKSGTETYLPPSNSNVEAPSAAPQSPPLSLPEQLQIEASKWPDLRTLRPPDNETPRP
jgi:hypothetical protein